MLAHGMRGGSGTTMHDVTALAAIPLAGHGWSAVCARCRQLAEGNSLPATRCRRLFFGDSSLHRCGPSREFD